MTGRNISHYEILEKLGAGGMGEIYKARDPRLNRTVAVKALPVSATADPERRRRFIQEAQAASGLNHPNIITIHDILSDAEGNDYMVMEFVSGKTLGELIPAEGLGIAKALQYSAQIADALSVAHAAGIVHRDLKPGNVMVTDRGRVKILDFGLAKVTAATSLTEATQTIASGPVTMEGSILGTVSYMSPEQAQGKKVDARSDIFAFGALLYEMVTGKKAFAGDSALTTLTAILRDEVPPASDTSAGVPPELDEVIGRSLRKDPTQRWQSMLDVYNVLAALRARYESGIMDATQILPPSPPPKKQMPWMLIGAGAVLTVMAASYLVLHRPIPVTPSAPVQQAPQPQQQAQAQPETPPAPAPAVEAAPTPTDTKPTTAVPATATAVKPVPKKDDGTLTNDSIIAMQQAKVAEAVMVSQIRSAAKTRFDLSTQEVIRLSKAGVPPAVLEAMRGLPAPHPATTAPVQPVTAPLPTAVNPTPPPPAPTKTVETRPVALSDAQPIVLSLSANVPNDPESGSALKFTVKQDVVVGGATVIAAGSVATGEVAGIKKGLPFRGGKPTFRLIAATAVDGTKIPLRATPGAGAGDRVERVIEPSGRKDKSVLAPAGTEYVGYVDGAHAVTVRK